MNSTWQPGHSCQKITMAASGVLRNSYAVLDDDVDMGEAACRADSGIDSMDDASDQENAR